MGETKFTPGPWAVCDYDDERAVIAITARAPGKDYRANVAYVGASCGCEPNAALIRAAPDLYYALEAALPYINTKVLDGKRMKEQVRAALASARGEAVEA